MFYHMQCGSVNYGEDRRETKRSDSCRHSLYKLGKNVSPVSPEQYEADEVHKYAGRFKTGRNMVGILCGPGELTSVQNGQHT